MKRVPSSGQSRTTPRKPEHKRNLGRNPDQGIRKDQRGQEQPADKKRARENR